MEKEVVKKEEQQFTAPVENAAEQQVEKKPWYKKPWGKIMIAAAVGLGVVGTAVAIKKLKGTETETATDNAVEVEEQKETPRENNRRDRFESRREKWNQQ